MQTSSSRNAIRPKLCINESCDHIFFVPRWRQALPLQCEGCVEKREVRREREKQTG